MREATMENFLITTEQPFRDYGRGGCIVYRGGRAERAWWGECDRRGIPFVMAYKQAKHWGVSWDFITLAAQRYELNRTPEYYDRIGAIIRRFWKLKKPHFGYSVGRMGRLTKDEAVECAALLFDALDGAKVKVKSRF